MPFKAEGVPNEKHLEFSLDCEKKKKFCENPRVLFTCNNII